MCCTGKKISYIIYKSLQMGWGENEEAKKNLQLKKIFDVIDYFVRTKPLFIIDPFGGEERGCCSTDS